MVYTAPNFNTQALDVNSVTEQFQSLSTDDKLGLLWVAYTWTLDKKQSLA